MDLIIGQSIVDVNKEKEILHDLFSFISRIIHYF